MEARIWPEGPVCPHCGGVDRIGKMGGKSTQQGQNGSSWRATSVDHLKCAKVIQNKLFLTVYRLEALNAPFFATAGYFNSK